MKAEERAMELFEWLDAKFGKECGHNHCNDGDRPPEYGARTASVAFLAAALTLAQQEARAERDSVWKAAVLGARKCGSTHSNACPCHDLRALLEGK